MVVWSAARDADLEADLQRVFGAVEERAHEVRLQDRDEHYWLYVARQAADPAA